jgi:hypothetical protein
MEEAVWLSAAVTALRHVFTRPESLTWGLLSWSDPPNSSVNLQIPWHSRVRGRTDAYPLKARLRHPRLCPFPPTDGAKLRALHWMHRSLLRFFNSDFRLRLHERGCLHSMSLQRRRHSGKVRAMYLHGLRFSSIERCCGHPYAQLSGEWESGCFEWAAVYRWWWGSGDWYVNVSPSLLSSNKTEPERVRYRETI